VRPALFIVMRADRHDILEAAFPDQGARFFLAMRIVGTPEQADGGCLWRG
jgi:hypothetical protein